MAVDYAAKYSNKVDEAFSTASVTQGAVNNEYTFDGVETVKVYSIATAPMNDYQMEGDKRYGNPSGLGNKTQTLELSRDRSFTFTIDRKDYDDTMYTMEAGKALARQIKLEVTPEIDIYRLSTMVANAGTTKTGAISKTNAYEAFLDGVTALNDLQVPIVGRMAYISSAFYKAIRLDESFIKASDLAQNMLVKGQVGMVDNIPLIYVPTMYLPENSGFLITHPIATVGPVKLAEYKVHDKPQGVSGWLVEGRVRYDAFVLDNKKNAIYSHMMA